MTTSDGAPGASPLDLSAAARVALLAPALVGLWLAIAWALRWPG